MNFFDSLISEVYSVFDGFSKAEYPFRNDNLWHDMTYSQVILQRDTSFELSGTGFNLVTSSALEDKIIVIGDDLDKITSDRKFARISLVQIDNEEDEQKAYNLIRKIEYVKYHIFPEGYMMRTSSRSHSEAVRIAKSALKKGVNFSEVGNLFISKYKEIPSVKNVTVIFVTEGSVDYEKLTSLAKKGNSITEALNHIMNSVNFDCSTCNLKPVCDEVEGMKELHFKNSSKGM